MFCRYEVRFKILWAKFCKKKERTHICTPIEVLVYLSTNAEEAPQGGATLRHSFLQMKLPVSDWKRLSKIA